MSTNPSYARLLALALLLPAAAPSWALYKIVGPDGSVTYSDRPPSTPNARVVSLGRDGQPQGVVAGPEAALPIELRQVATRFPVTLYTAADCAPCEMGRALLQQRGVPYSERRIVTDEDASALERLVGGRTVPALTVGSQSLRGLSETDWTAYLDAAGYPRESRLPRGWQPPAATALTERVTPRTAAAVPAPAAAPQAAEPPPADEAAPTPAPGFRF